MVPDPTFSLFSTNLVVVSVVFPVISTLFVAARFYVRHTSRQKLGADDWTAFASLVLCWALGVNMWVFASQIGINRIREDPRSATLDTYKFFWANEIPFTIVLGSTKISVLFFYHRLFAIPTWRKIAWGMIAIITAWTIAVLIVSIFKTTPISGIWTDPENTYNIDETTYSLTVAGMSLGFDVIILSMPVFVIRTLHMPLARKIAVVFIFWLGALCCVCGAVRLALLYQSLHAVSENPNLYATLTTMMIWAEAEPNVSVVACSLPMLRPLVASGHESLIKPWFSTLGSRFRFSRMSSRGDAKLDNGYSSSGTPSGERASNDNGSTTRLHRDVELSRV